MYFDVRCEIRVGDVSVTADIVSDARLTALVGPSGIGKTTVLNAVAGLLEPENGRIEVAGQVLFDKTNGTDLPPERRRAGYVFQDARLFPHRRIAANLAYGERLADPAGRWIARANVVELLEIGPLLDRWPSTLSGGEMRRVAIGRALLAAPRFLLLDEPLASLDGERAEALSTLIERIRDELDIPILLVSHSATDVARLAGKVVEMVEADGTRRSRPA